MKLLTFRSRTLAIGVPHIHDAHRTADSRSLDDDRPRCIRPAALLGSDRRNQSHPGLSQLLHQRTAGHVRQPRISFRAPARFQRLHYRRPVRGQTHSRSCYRNQCLASAAAGRHHQHDISRGSTQRDHHKQFCRREHVGVSRDAEVEPSLPFGMGTGPAVPRRRTRLPNLAGRCRHPSIAIRGDRRCRRRHQLWQVARGARDPLHAMGGRPRLSVFSDQAGSGRVSD